MSRKRKHPVAPAAPAATSPSLPAGPLVEEPADAAPAAPVVAQDDVADDSAPLDPSTPHAVEALASSFGATDAEVELVVGAITPGAIKSAAAEAGTARLCNEVFRVGSLAQDFFLVASARAVASLHLSPVVVKVMVTCAARASAGSRQSLLRVVQKRSATPVTAAEQEQQLQQARDARDQLAAALRGLHTGDPAALERVRLAAQPNSAGHGDAGPGRALASLVTLGRAAVDDKTLAPRAELWGVTAPWLDACEALVAPAMEATAAQSAPAAPTVASAGVMRWRGLSMLLLRRVLSVFGAGHAVDVDVPEIAPLYLRAVLAPKNAPRKKPAAKPASPATPAAPAADTKPAPTG